MIAIPAVVGIIVLLIVAWFAWQVFGPSRIVIRNVGDQSVQLVLTDVDRTAEVWSGQLEPGRRKVVTVWFRGEGAPELRCRDRTSSNTTNLGYVTGHMPMSADIEIAGCSNFPTTVQY
jgi:hypothetical protein